MKVSIMKAIGFGISFAVGIALAQVAMGMYATHRYVPNIAEQYETVDALQSTVSFGFPSDPTQVALGGGLWFLGVASLGAILYAAGSELLRRRKRKQG